MQLSGFLDESNYSFTRFFIQRTLAFIYFIAFLATINQFKGLCGERGLLPVQHFLKRITFWDSPSVFFAHFSDGFALVLAWVGLILALIALSGLSDAFGLATSVLVWFSLWLLYLSFVNVGQTFYSFGWESLLLESGFLAIFLGPTRSPVPTLIIWLFRWIVFRLMFGAGLIKIRGDDCWRSLTCMQYHYETQPMPNPLSWYFHHLPVWIQKGSVLFTHFVELIVPFFIFGPRWIRGIAGLLTILFQGTLILSGNLSWLNYLTIVLTISCFDDSLFLWLGLKLGFTNWPQWLTWAYWLNQGPSVTGHPALLIYGWTAFVLLMSIRPVMNLVSSRQIMNTSFDPLHLINTYGAFGSVTRIRNEIIIEGTTDPLPGPGTQWKEYEFKGKPGNPTKRPPVVAPYHMRLDWLMWFAAMGDYSYYPWTLNLVGKLLQNDSAILDLIAHNPFPDQPPKFIRAELYEYRFTDWGEKESRIWNRRRVGPYLPPLSLGNANFRAILQDQGWLQNN